MHPFIHVNTHNTLRGSACGFCTDFLLKIGIGSKKLKNIFCGAY